MWTRKRTNFILWSKLNNLLWQKKEKNKENSGEWQVKLQATKMSTIKIELWLEQCYTEVHTITTRIRTRNIWVEHWGSWEEWREEKGKWERHGQEDNQHAYQIKSYENAKLPTLYPNLKFKLYSNKRKIFLDVFESFISGYNVTKSTPISFLPVSPPFPLLLSSSDLLHSLNILIFWVFYTLVISLNNFYHIFSPQFLHPTPS